MLLSEAITLFLDHRTAEGYAFTTVDGDRKRLWRIFDIVGDMPFEKFDAVQYDKVQAIEARRGLSAGTLNNVHSSVAAFTKWGHARGYLPSTVSPLAGRRRRVDPPKEKFMMGIGSFAAVLDAADKHDPRDRALIALALFTMCRQSEIRSLRVKDLDLNTGTLYVRVHKSAKDDRMPVSTELDSEMRRWLTHYAKEAGPLQPDWFLIPTRGMVTFEQRGYVPTQMMSKTQPILQRALRDIGIPKMPYQDGMHLLRRSAARALYDELVDKGYDGAMRQVQTWLHHSSVTMTERYLGLSVDRDTRDKEVRGKALFPSLVADNVVELRRSHG